MKKYIILLLSIFVFTISRAQTISAYSDGKIPSKLAAEIESISIDNFETFSASGVENPKTKSKQIKYTYNVKYEDGYIIGTISIFKGNDNNAFYSVKLPFKYCCAHNPVHCANSKDEMKRYQDSNKCINWHRVQVD